MEAKTRIAAIIIQDGKMLLQKGRGYDELWTPGGKVDGNETDLECLARELKEELKVTFISGTFFKEYQTVSFYNPDQPLIERAYIVTIEGAPIPSAEIESVIWYSKEDYLNHVYKMIHHTQNDLIPDLIQQKIW